jgi:Dolichyl-phosphate-mannose-protein mannosyltransferase
MGVRGRRGAWVASCFGRLAVVLLLVGIGLRIGQYAIGAALWYDELALARNAVDKPIRELLTVPLDHAQVAPPGFLLIEKAAISALGNNEYALRLFPLLCALVALPLFADVARRTLPPGAALLAVALFSLSPTVISLGSQVKQYSTDVAAALLMAALTLRWWERRHADRAVPGAALLGATGLVAVWFSQAAVVVLAGLGLALLLEAGLQRDRGTFWSLALIGILWGVGMLGAVAWGLQSMSPSIYAFMQAYWAEGFMPLPPWSGDSVLWLWRAFRGFFQGQLRYPLPAVCVLLMLLGAVTLARRRRWPALVVLAPVCVSLMAAAARQYPFGDRTSLFLLPGILLPAVAGLDQLRHAVAAWWRPLGAAVVALAMTAPVYALYAYYPMYLKQPMPDVLAYVQARRQPDDAVYVHHGAGHAVGYYGLRYGLPLQAVVIGGCPQGDPRRLLNDLEQFRGLTRFWVIISHASGPFRERETMLGYLDAIGVQRDSISIGGSRLSPRAYLYDLSDPERLRSASAETHTLPAREQGVREYPCIAAFEAPGPVAPTERLGRAK